MHQSGVTEVHLIVDYSWEQIGASGVDSLATGCNEIGRRVTTPHAGYDRAVGHHVTLEFLALVDQQGIVDDSIVHGDI